MANSQVDGVRASRRIALHWQVLIALVLGVLVGAAVNQWWTAETWARLGVGDSAAYVAGKASAANEGAGSLAAAAAFVGQAVDFVGKLFLRALRFIAVPIVLFSLVVAVASLGDPRKLGRVGGRTIVLFLATGVTSAVIGVTLATLVKPGSVVGESARGALPGGDLAARAASAEQGAQAYSVWRVVLEAIPENPFAALAGAQMLQIVVASIALGLGLTLIPAEKARPVTAVLDGLAEAVLKLVQLLMRAAPIAVFCLVVTIISGLGLGVFGALIVYALVVVAGLAVILFVLYPTLTTVFTGGRVGWGRFFRAMAPAQLFAFSSSSSAATLPVTMQCCRERLGASERITGFVCSLGVSFNMDGTAMYQAVVVTFLAQLYGVPLGYTELITVALMAAALSIGVPGIPGGSLVVMAVVLDSVKVPTEGIAIILAVDRVLDMCRTVINVSGDAMGTAIIAHGEGELARDPLA